jgi:hypothetical protein
MGFSGNTAAVKTDWSCLFCSAMAAAVPRGAATDRETPAAASVCPTESTRCKPMSEVDPAMEPLDELDVNDKLESACDNPSEVEDSEDAKRASWDGTGGTGESLTPLALAVPMR